MGWKMRGKKSKVQDGGVDYEAAKQEINEFLLNIENKHGQRIFKQENIMLEFYGGYAKAKDMLSLLDCIERGDIDGINGIEKFKYVAQSIRSIAGKYRRHESRVKFFKLSSDRESLNEFFKAIKPEILPYKTTVKKSVDNFERTFTHSIEGRLGFVLGGVENIVVGTPQEIASSYQNVLDKNYQASSEAHVSLQKSCKWLYDILYNDDPDDQSRTLASDECASENKGDIEKFRSFVRRYCADKIAEFRTYDVDPQNFKGERRIKYDERESAEEQNRKSMEAAIAKRQQSEMMRSNAIKDIMDMVDESIQGIKCYIEEYINENNLQTVDYDSLTNILKAQIGVDCIPDELIKDFTDSKVEEKPLLVSGWLYDMAVEQIDVINALGRENSGSEVEEYPAVVSVHHGVPRDVAMVNAPPPSEGDAGFGLQGGNVSTNMYVDFLSSVSGVLPPRFSTPYPGTNVEEVNRSNSVTPPIRPLG